MYFNRLHIYYMAVILFIYYVFRLSTGNTWWRHQVGRFRCQQNRPWHRFLLHHLLYCTGSDGSRSRRHIRWYLQHRYHLVGVMVRTFVSGLLCNKTFIKLSNCHQIRCATYFWFRSRPAVVMDTDGKHVLGTGCCKSSFRSEMHQVLPRWSRWSFGIVTQEEIEFASKEKNCFLNQSVKCDASYLYLCLGWIVLSNVIIFLFIKFY